MPGVSRRLCRQVIVAVAAIPLSIAFIAVSSSSAHAQTAAGPTKESSVTLYGGYRFGGKLTEVTTRSTVNLASGGSYALAVDIGLDRQSQLQLFYSHQDSALTSSAFSPKANNVGLTLHNYHLGGTYFIDEVGKGLYVVGGIGGTTAQPDRNDLNAETFFSGNLGIGWMIPLGRYVGIRFEARGYGILVHNSSALFCGSNTGCVFGIKGEGVYTGEALVGLSVRF